MKVLTLAPRPAPTGAQDSKTHRRHRRALVGAACVLLAGCADDREAAQALRKQLETQEEPVAPGRSAQIRVVAEFDGAGGRAPAIFGEARFAVFHGMNEEFARSRIDLTEPALDRLEAGQCSPVGGGEEVGDVGRAGPLSWRDLNLVDVGAIELRVGGQKLALNHTLTPDLVGWMSGLEYRLRSDAFALGALDAAQPTRVQIDVAGAPEEDLPPFGLGAPLPPTPRELSLGMQPDSNDLQLSWSASDAGSAPLLLRLRRGQAKLDCLVPDTGAFTVSAEALDAADLATSEHPLEVGATIELLVSRFHRVSVSAGDFEDIDVVLESQLDAELPLRLISAPAN